MVSVTKIKVQYTNRLDSMVKFLRKYILTYPLEKQEEIFDGISEFCHNYPPEFKDEFIKRVGLKRKIRLPLREFDKSIANKFVDYLTKKEGECIFLLRDSYISLKKYQKKTNKGFGILINRKYLFDKEEDYFLFVDIFYKSLLKSSNKVDFLNLYLEYFKAIINENPQIMRKSKEVFEMINSTKKENKIIWVDIGFQFTFCLFGYFSVLIHSNNTIKQDFIVFSVYPWLKNIFKENYFSDKNEYVLNLEEESIKKYEESLVSKSSGCLLGFAIGDSLGFPVAGIDKKDIKRFLNSEIINFEDNPKHPFFSHLKKGQYTNNTDMLLISIENIIKNNGFNVESYQKSLISWLNNIKKDKYKERWLGPIALKAFEDLSKGKDYRNSGSISTESCSSSYRVIPLGIFYRNRLNDLKQFTNISSGITHNSDISKTGSLIVSAIILNLMNGNLPETAIKSALNIITKTQDNSKLIDKIKLAIEFSKSKTINEARKFFGTGSPINQTLPLTVFCFLKQPENFEKSILLAANSYRDDTPEEKERLKNLSWKEKLIETKGGNTDGIAGLTGAFLGAYLGKDKIPNKFMKIENKDKIIKLGTELVKNEK